MPILCEAAVEHAPRGSPTDEQVMNGKVQVVQFGFGPIGQGLAREVLGARDLQLAGAVDRSPGIAGKPLEEFLGPEAHGLPRVVPNLGDLPFPPPPRVVLHATGSRLASVLREIEEILSCGYHCVSSCEELSFPFLRNPEIGGRLDALARKHRVGLVGAGVNPGFILDLLPAILTTACRRVDRIEGTRTVDVEKRREPLQRKVGLGLSLDAYRTKESAEGSMGHVGLGESAALLGSAVGWTGGEVTETSEPIIADRAVSLRDRSLPAGTVLGTRTRARLVLEGKERIALEVVLAVGVEREEDRVRLEGDPPLLLVIPGGIPGDTATASILVSVARRIPSVGPGLHTVLTLPIVPLGPARLT